MKRDDRKKLLTQTPTELMQLVQKAQQELVDLRMQKALNQNKNVHEYKIKRQQLAIMKTALKQKQLAATT